MRRDRLHSSTGRLCAIQSRTCARNARSAGSSSVNSVVLSHTGSGPQHRQAIAEHDVVAPERAALERYHLALPPDLGADRIAGKHRLGETRLDAGEALRLIIRDRTQDRMRRDAEARGAVQNRAVEAGDL